MDLRYAIRQLRKNPGFALIAAMTLALGIGANSAMFSFVHAWILRPLPYPNAEQLMVVWEKNTKNGRQTGVSPANFLDWREKNTVFESVAGWSHATHNLTGSGEPEKLRSAVVTANFFDTMGIAPALGRSFLAGEDEPGAGRSVILAHNFWRDRFGSDPAVLGRAISLDGEAHTIAGVMPAGFHLPLMGRAQIWTPLVLTPAQREHRDVRWMRVIARTKPGAGKDQATAGMDTLTSALRAAYPAQNADAGALIRTLHEEIGRHSGNQQVAIAFAVVGFVLLIACANVANLLLSRATARRREVAVRLAVGASRFQLVRQFLVETLLLFTIGGVLGSLLAVWGVDWMTSAIPYENRGYLPEYGRITVNLAVLGYTLGVALLTGLVFGLLPAFESTRLDLNESLKVAVAGVGQRFRTGRMRKALVIAEVALAMIVVCSAGLLVNSFVRMMRVDPGFDATRAVGASIELDRTKYADGNSAARFFTDAVERLREFPGIAAAGASQFTPFGGNSASGTLVVEGRPVPPPGQAPSARFTAITPGYLAAMSTPLISGRGIAPSDGPDAPRVALVSETLARRFFTNQDPLGQKIRVGRQSTNVLTIVGVVRDVKFTELIDPPENQVYLSWLQSPARSMSLVARTSGDPAPAAASIRAAVRAIDPNQPVSRIVTIDQQIEETVAPWRILTAVFGFFATLALLLAAIGVYGVMAFAVSSRTREIGLRMALGARSTDVSKLVLRQGMTLAGIGLVTGLAGALGMARLMSDFLYSVTSWDPPTFGSVAVLLSAVAVIACWVPARRAARVDPIVALRHE